MMEEEELFTRQRLKMVAEQLKPRGIHDERVIAAMRSVPRHKFIPENMRRSAYQDGPLPIGNGQTISQPYIVAFMTELLCLPPSTRTAQLVRVLEIGTGSGYQAAILAQMNYEVYTIERYPTLARQASDTLQALGYAQVHVFTADGSLGWEAAAPYQGILISAAAPTVPRALLNQLTDSGRLVVPVGGPGGQDLQCWTRRGEHFQIESILAVSFVPLRGKAGWDEKDWQGMIDSN